MPIADALVWPDRADVQEERFPLVVGLCAGCGLVQLLHDVPSDAVHASEYLYLSSVSPLLVDHARAHAKELIASRKLDGESLVIEVGSNDGYLLRNFVERGVQVLGIDPATAAADAARAKGVPTLVEPFSPSIAQQLVTQGARADVVIANQVLETVTDPDAMVAGISSILATDGVVTIESPYVCDLIDGNEFDLIHHRHLSYFSATAVDALARRHGLLLQHVQRLPDLYGGGARWWMGRDDEVSSSVSQLLAQESERSVPSLDYYAHFAGRAERTRTELRSLLEDLERQGARLAAYGAAAKGCTLLNFVGLDAGIIDFVVDRNPHKQGLLMPGARIPILSPDALLERQPDYVLLLAWNFRPEILDQQAEYAARGGRFVVPIPAPEII